MSSLAVVGIYVFYCLLKFIIECCNGMLGSYMYIKFFQFDYNCKVAFRINIVVLVCYVFAFLCPLFC